MTQLGFFLIKQIAIVFWIKRYIFFNPLFFQVNDAKSLTTFYKYLLNKILFINYVRIRGKFNNMTHLLSLRISEFFFSKT